MREGVGVLDQTSFAKYEVRGPGARRLLDRLCANALPLTEGRIALTQMGTPRGGIECDVTVSRLSPDSYYIVTGTGFATHDFSWIERAIPAGLEARLIDDVTAPALLIPGGHDETVLGLNRRPRPNRAAGTSWQ